jgi:hypothetical protein
MGKIHDFIITLLSLKFSEVDDGVWFILFNFQLPINFFSTLKALESL